MSVAGAEEVVGDAGAGAHRGPPPGMGSGEEAVLSAAGADAVGSGGDGEAGAADFAFRPPGHPRLCRRCGPQVSNRHLQESTGVTEPEATP